MDLSVPKKPNRTHRITVQSLKSPRQSKTFSIYTVKHTDKFLFKEMEKVLNDKKLKREDYFDLKCSSHTAILENFITGDYISKCFNLHSYSVYELYDLLKKKFLDKEGEQ